jgi:hypothetical protein
MSEYKDIPVAIENDPRIGKRAKVIATGFEGIVERALRFPDGLEYISIRDSHGNGVGGLTVDEVEIGK